MIRGHLLTSFFVLAVSITSAYAHEVHHNLQIAEAVVVQLKYADGQPFAFEAFEATPEGATLPVQVGRTDAQGRAVFLPDRYKRWKLKTYSADGHGVTLDFDAPAAIAPTITSSGEAPNRASIALFGLSMLIGAFGLYQLFLKNKAQ